jgi:uncharacterized membrane protein
MSTASIFQKESAGSQRLAGIRRWGALLGGGALAVYGLTRRSAAGVAMAATGGLLAYVGATVDHLPKEIESYNSILVNCSREEAYRFWHDANQLPLFMRHLESFSKIGERQYRWTVLGPTGSRITWDTEMWTEREPELIAWRSMPDNPVNVEGSVEFRTAPANRGTIVEFRMHYGPLSGFAGKAIAKIFGQYPDFILEQDLRRFKALVETGEIPTTEGQSHGPRSAVVAIARLADPSRPLRPGSDLKQVFRAMRRTA